MKILGVEFITPFLVLSEVIVTKEIKLSVRSLVEFILRGGSIDNRFIGGGRPLEGTRAHQKVQKSYKENYKAEFSLKLSFTYKEIDFLIEGRADGVLFQGEEVIIDEIKSTNRPLILIDEDYKEVHWAQAKCYAYIYSLQNNLKSIGVQLTYYNLDSNDIKILKRDYSKVELEEFFFEIINEFYNWAMLSKSWEETRNLSIENLEFPHESYRKGQRDLAIRVYKSVKEGKKCFAQAPTGIGKTISTLFPAIKAMGEGHTSKIFYLTAKAIGREVANSSINKMREKGLRFKSVTLTAKDKVCLMDKTKCNPDYCKYANGYYDRVNSALMNFLISEVNFSRETIEKYCTENLLCPFEFSLDLTLFSDAVICDYNYLFDPKVYLKRFFEIGSDYCFLIDEAHNLIDRGRDMYSSILSKKPILNQKKEMKKKDKKIYKMLDKLNTFMVGVRKQCDENGYHYTKEEPLELYSILKVFVEVVDEYFKDHQGEENEELLQLYFDAHSFLRIGELYDDRYVTYYESNEEVSIKLFCLDPSKLLKDAMKKGKTSVIFSATLIPLKYFIELLGNEEEDYVVKLSSPFSEENRKIIIGKDISTRYKNREKSYDQIVDYIESFSNCKMGNYMVFFPSYQYMISVYEKFIEKHTAIKAVIQDRDMGEEEKEKFLREFKASPMETHIGFCVMGGHFSEGIDLTLDRLIGICIIGVGLPKISVERDIIKEYFDGKNGSGFEYAYMYPGFTKVLQAVGRCIRTEQDKGAILLLDERFIAKRYENLFPREWYPNEKIKEIDELKRLLNNFW